MANITKLILPIATDCITKKYIDPSYNMGFVDAYLEDKNRPYLGKKLFLMYRTDNIHSDALIGRWWHFSTNKYFYNRTFHTINDELYEVYAFSLIGNDVLGLLEGIMPTDPNTYLNIHKFWELKDDFINSLILNKHTTFDTSGEDCILPEADYVDDDLPGLMVKKSTVL